GDRERRRSRDRDRSRRYFNALWTFFLASGERDMERGPRSDRAADGSGDRDRRRLDAAGERFRRSVGGEREGFRRARGERGRRWVLCVGFFRRSGEESGLEECRWGDRLDVAGSEVAGGLSGITPSFFMRMASKSWSSSEPDEDDEDRLLLTVFHSVDLSHGALLFEIWTDLLAQEVILLGGLAIVGISDPLGHLAGD
ncbi:hypothetical protein TCAL_16307, partial [Tigriopus californicus]